MKTTLKLIACMVVGYIVLWGLSQIEATDTDPHRALLDAMYSVETSSGNHPGSLGPYQLKMIYVIDVNRILKLQGSDMRFKGPDRHDKGLSEEMIQICWGHYQCVTDEERAYNFHRAKDGYWDKIKERIE